MAHLLHVKDEEIGAFRARLRHLKDSGVPDVPKVGKGKQIWYTRDDAVRMYVALKMMQYGITPKAAAFLITDLGNSLHHPAVSAIGAGPVGPSGEDVFYTIGYPAGVDHYVYSYTRSQLMETINNLPWTALAIINISQCIRSVDEELAKH